MKIKKIITTALLGALALCTVFAFTGCSSKFETPKDFTFEDTTGKYSFKTVSSADTYQVAVQKIIDEKTAKGIASQNQSSLVTNKDSSGAEKSFYIWSELTGSASGLKDTDGDGEISGTVTFRAYSSHAQQVGSILKISELPLAHYYVTCVAEATADKEQSDPAWKEIVVGGTLQTPVVSTSVSGSKMTVALNAAYVKNAFLYTGIPSKVEVTVNDGASNTVLTYDDWSYTNSVIGPEKSFTFTNISQEISYDSSKSYTISAKAIGDGDKIKDSAVAAYNAGSYASKVPGDYFTDITTTSLTGTVDSSATATLKFGGGKYSMELAFGSCYYLSSYGTYTTVADDDYTFTHVGGDTGYEISDFAITEWDGTAIKQASASVKLTKGMLASSTNVTASVSYTKSSGGGWGGPPG